MFLIAFDNKLNNKTCYKHEKVHSINLHTYLLIDIFYNFKLVNNSVLHESTQNIQNI